MLKIVGRGSGLPMSSISVCLTHYNRPNKLAATVESLARQTRVPDEVLLWDDHSLRDPTEIALSFRNRFPKFIFHRNTHNLNMPGNLNAVLAGASCDYVANLHDADIFRPDLIEKWAAALDRHDSAGFVFCGLDTRHDNPFGGQISLPDIPALTVGREFFEKWFMGNANSVIWGTVMARKCIYDKLLPFNEKYRNWADVDMWMRMCQLADVAYVPEPLIILDNTQTKLRAFSWYKVIVMQEMIGENIQRHYANDIAALSMALEKQRSVLFRRLLRHLAGRLIRCRLGAFYQGAKVLAAAMRQERLGDGTLLDFVSRVY